MFSVRTVGSRVEALRRAGHHSTVQQGVVPVPERPGRQAGRGWLVGWLGLLAAGRRSVGEVKYACSYCGGEGLPVRAGREGGGAGM